MVMTFGLPIDITFLKDCSYFCFHNYRKMYQIWGYIHQITVEVYPYLECYAHGVQERNTEFQSRVTGTHRLV